MAGGSVGPRVRDIDATHDERGAFVDRPVVHHASGLVRLVAWLDVASRTLERRCSVCIAAMDMLLERYRLVSGFWGLSAGLT